MIFSKRIKLRHSHSSIFLLKLSICVLFGDPLRGMCWFCILWKLHITIREIRDLSVTLSLVTVGLFFILEHQLSQLEKQLISCNSKLAKYEKQLLEVNVKLEKTEEDARETDKKLQEITNENKVRTAESVSYMYRFFESKWRLNCANS